MKESTFGELISLIPAVACMLAFVPLYRRWPPFRPALPILIVTALGIRWLFLIVFTDPSGDVGFDTESFRIVG